MTQTIRPIAAEDEARWRELWEGYNKFYKRTIAEEVTANTFSRFLNKDVPMFCAVAVLSEHGSADKVIGFVTWYPHLNTASIEDVVYLNDLFVDPEIRNLGTGGKLIDHVLEHAKTELNAESVYWHTQHFNHAAQLLYVKKAEKSDYVHYNKVLKK